MKHALIASAAVFLLTSPASATSSSSLLPNFHPAVGKYHFTAGFGTAHSKHTKIGDYTIKSETSYLTAQLDYGFNENIILSLGIGHSLQSRFKQHPEPAPRILTGTSNPSFALAYKYGDVRNVPRVFSISLTPKTSNDGIRAAPTSATVSWRSGYMFEEGFYWTYGAGLDWQDKVNSYNVSSRTLNIGSGLAKVFNDRITGAARFTISQKESQRFPMGNARSSSSPSTSAVLTLGYKVNAATELVFAFDSRRTKSEFEADSSSFICDPQCVPTSSPVREKFKSRSDGLNIKLVKLF